MKSQIKMMAEWKDISNLEQAKELIIHSDLLESSQIRFLKKTFSVADQEELCRFFAQSLCETSNDLLSFEIISDNFLLWVNYEYDQNGINAFIQTFLAHTDACLALKTLTELVLGGEVSEEARQGELYPLALALICELGIRIVENERNGKLQPNQRTLLKQINTYLLSVSNSTHIGIRLSLVHYFGFLSRKGSEETSAFNRVMGRFGQTILDQLMAMLYVKKTEAIALMFLMENLPYILEGSSHCQKMLHEALKNSMLKQPDRFNLFLEAISEYLLRPEKIQAYPKAGGVFIQHLGALFKVCSELNHKILAKDLLVNICRFKALKESQEMLDILLRDGSIRLTLRQLVRSYQDPSSTSGRSSLGTVRPSKRGRKPSFSKAPDLSAFGQVNFLGAVDLIKAS